MSQKEPKAARGKGVDEAAKERLAQKKNLVTTAKKEGAFTDGDIGVTHTQVRTTRSRLLGNRQRTTPSIYRGDSDAGDSFVVFDTDPSDPALRTDMDPVDPMYQPLT